MFLFLYFPIYSIYHLQQGQLWNLSACVNTKMSYRNVEFLNINDPRCLCSNSLFPRSDYLWYDSSFHISLIINIGLFRFPYKMISTLSGRRTNWIGKPIETQHLCILNIYSSLANQLMVHKGILMDYGC